MRILRSLLALVLLASVAHAAPEGWERINGAWRSVGVQNDAQAQERGGEFYLNLEELRLEMYPWRDGSGDVLTLRPVLPPGTRVVRPDGAPVRDGLIEVAHGWRADLEGGALDGVVLRLMDLQGDKVPEALDSFLAPGLALIYTYDSASVPTTGEWLAKRIAFGGIADQCSFAIHNIADLLPGSTYPEWAPGSIAIYHDTKRNNGGFRKYTTGKIAHMPRPLMVGRNANGITGYAFGKYREVSHGVFDKVFDMDAILADPSQTITKFGIGAPTSIHISADLGYTDVGVNEIGSTNQLLMGGSWLATENGTIDSITIGIDAVPVNVAIGLYDDSTTTPGDLLFDSRITTSFTVDGDKKTVTASGSIVDGTYYYPATTVQNSSNGVLYDTSIAGKTFWRQSVSSDPMPDPTTAGSLGANLAMTGYVSYTPAATTPVTTNVAADPTNPAKGATFDLSADIDTASETITAAEYYQGSDPGEGSATAMSLGAGTISREATATVDTTSYPLGSNSIWVRGFDAVNGWGASASVAISVIVPQPQNVAAVGGDTTVTVTWDDVDYEESYTLFWDTASPVTIPGSNQITLIAAGSTSYEHTGRTNGVTYFYAVRAIASAAASLLSAEVSAEAGAVTGGDSSGLNLGLGLGL